MDKNKRMPRLLPIFLEEMSEHVRTLNQGVLALEKGADGEARVKLFRELFRAAHSLKGAARSANVILIEGACHRLEGVLTAARDGTVPLDAGLFALLFATADAIEEAGQRLREQNDLGDAPLSAVLPRLDAALSQPAAPARDVAPQPEAPARDVPPQPAAPSRDTSPLAGAAGWFGPSQAATVRIPAARLDTLLARTGELLVARRRVETRAADLSALREFVEQWKGEWQRVEKSFADLLPGEGKDSSPSLPRRAALVLRRAGDNLRRLDKDLDRLAAAAVSDGRLLKQVAGPLNEEVHRARMLPFAEACEGLDRMVRDLAQATGKEVELVLEGGAVELDRSVLEGLKDPLRHLVRNAVDHGAESPAQRQAAGKSPQARVRVTAALRGARVEVVVEDDGHGLDLAALRQQARRRGLPEPADNREAANLVFLPGLSTAPRITDVSGRGVGLDVVKSRLEALHGTAEVAPLTPTPLPPGERGRGEGAGGTRFTLTVPLTLTTLRAVLVTAAGQTFAFVGSSVERLVRIGPGDRKTVAGRPVLARGGPPLPLASLAAVLGLPAEAPAEGGKVPAVIVAGGDRRVVFTVDELQAEQEIVVQGLGSRVRRLRHVSGATLLASGQVALVLNAASLVRSALGAPVIPLPAADTTAPTAPPRKRLLVVDDSVTTRTLEKSILESAGYEVVTAIDGQAAWDILQNQGADLLVSDVEMPRMDGFELARAVRSSKRFRDLPVVLVTSRESEQDKARGLEAGADAYVLKSGFDQRNLLKTIAQLLQLRSLMLRTIVAEDSATARSLLVAILSADPEIQVVGEAHNGAEAVALTRQLRPDVVTMDITMPLMDGFEATREIMASVPTPIVIVTASGLAREVQTSLQALQAGALAVLPKPPGPGAAGFEEAARQLVANVKALSQVKVVRRWRPHEPGVRGQGSGVSRQERLSSADPWPLTPDPWSLVAIATSTGGPAALHRLFAALPGDFPLPILVVQHIARGFTDGLADWLGKSTALRVKVAADREPLAPHTVYLAPEDRHLGVSRLPAVVLSSEAPVGGFRPSGTFLFASSARSRGPGTIALILTGMGSDGVEGLAEVRRAGGHVVAQDESSSIIFGMPGAAIAAGLADVVLPLDTIPAHLMELVRHESAKRPPRAGR